MGTLSSKGKCRKASEDGIWTLTDRAQQISSPSPSPHSHLILFCQGAGFHIHESYENMANEYGKEESERTKSVILFRFVLRCFSCFCFLPSPVRRLEGRGSVSSKETHLHSQPTQLLKPSWDSASSQILESSINLRTKFVFLIITVTISTILESCNTCKPNLCFTFKLLSIWIYLKCDCILGSISYWNPSCEWEKLLLRYSFM